MNPVGITEDSVHCLTPAYTSVKSETLKLHVGTKLEFTALSAFHAYDDSSLAVTSVFPGGGAYNLVANIYVGGTMLNYGAPRCRFGKPEENLYGNTGVWLNSTHIKCEKPRFPDSYRDSLGSYDLTVTPNGQCYAASKGSFTTYNALTDGVLLLGAPATSSVEIDITGEGYVALAGGLCFFKQIGLPAGTTPQTFAKPLSVQSSTLARCSTPAAGIANQRYAVSVSINGLSVEPNKFAGVDIEFKEYDLSEVRISHLEPPGGPVGVSTSVTIVGSGFAQYGVGQLKCLANGALVEGLL